jgi:hypothetical protein
VVTLLAGPSATSGVGSAVIELAQQGTPVFWKVIDEESPQSVVCSATPQPNCVVVDATGAHASAFYGFLVHPTSMTQFDTNVSDTPDTKAVDLNADGWIDVVTEQNTYLPTYATGTVYWQTFTSDGVHLSSTGCSVPVNPNDLAPAPSAPLTGTCSS